MLDQVNKKEEVKVQMGLTENLIPSMECSSSVMEPAVPKGGVVIQVQYAGVYYSEGQLRKTGLRPRLPGFEVSGTIYSVCKSLPNSKINLGDRVILYPDEEQNDERNTEFIPVGKVEHVIQLPQNVDLAVAAMLPGGALQAYSAVLKAKAHVEKLLEVKPCVNVLIVGAGGLGLWSIRLAQSLMGRSNSTVRLFVADNSIDKLLTAQEHDCFDIIHWCEEEHEQSIIERTLEACRGGVDIVIDFVSSPRTMQRSLMVLNRVFLIECSPSLCHFVQSAIKTTGVHEEIGYNSVRKTLYASILICRCFLFKVFNTTVCQNFFLSCSSFTRMIL
ncbi:hypothetical protein CHS0354_024286 [Potamilus streckersoni]|uniref:Alcohol dehydrogenase-like N-terminal domain-containing protein n=1 Tax=Potamilus streckersoni TaxID=2493646 RepID=A0AAE0RLN0_9BIVA|nr:hypothetical protein CHS0354_024286 [Potamilus streckersoni]